MFKQEYEAAANGAVAKLTMMEKNLAGYFVLSLLAGAYVGFGILLANTIGGTLQGTPAMKLAMSVTFCIALSLVVICGAELVTGNMLVMSAGVFRKKVSLWGASKLWIVCWIGNLVGAIILGVIFYFSGLDVDATANMLASAAVAKSSAGIVPLIMRGILCNVLVCLAIWSGFRCKSESAKLIMVFWCLLAFFACGFEHCVANMTIFTVALLNPAGQAVTLAGAGYNLLWATVGNLIGGVVFVSLPYMIAARDK